MWGFREVYLVDFEFQQLDGGVPTPICMVAREYFSGKLIQVWLWGERTTVCPPIPTGPDVLFVAYYSAAELLCFLALGWDLPERILDLCVEFKRRTSGLKVPCGRSLLGALVSHGLPSMASEHKEEMRQLAIRGGPFNSDERRALLHYCQEDVDALAKLLPAMAREIRPRLGQALLRGREMAAIARMEWTGIPIDVATWERVRDELPELREQLIQTVDREFGVYENSVFKRDRFAALLAKRGVPWPRLPSGALELKDQTFRDMCRAHPWLSPLRELRYTLGQLKLHDLAVGPDGRNRCMLSAFRSKTGRNQPSNTKFVFGPAVWIRGFIQPEPETALVYLDWEQQEFGIAASLSGDAAMTAAYTSNDPYLAFAIQAGAAPVDATKASHPDIREAFKACVLAVQYGMGARALGLRIGKPAPYAEELLDLHRKTYSRFWNWSDGAVRRAMFTGSLETVFGWEVHVDNHPNERSLRNFPMQGNGSEMLRLGCALMTEQGIRVCAPVHDAVLLEAPIGELEHTVERAREAMAEASSVVLAGFELRTDTKIVRHPERYADPRGEGMWRTILSLVAELPGSCGSNV